ncbi:RNA-binding domain superfamily [Sesbania bispinosa]|nr:RNA-binding domain superfamily [Sesbania bispinosa]
MATVTATPHLLITVHFPQNDLTAKAPSMTMLSHSLQLLTPSKPLNPNAEPFYIEHRRMPEKKEKQLRALQQPPQGSSSQRMEANTSGTTTVMIRNVPNQYKLEDLLLIMDDHCLQQNKTVNDPSHLSKFDFLYLLMDYRKHAVERKMSNLGYAFVNLTTPFAAFKFYEKFEGFMWNVKENRKKCEINAAQYQGKDKLMSIFGEKVFRCKSRDFLPVAFSVARDGLNPPSKGIPVGKHVWGLPTTSIGTRASFRNY